MYDFKYVKNFIESNNCKLLSKEYKNEREKLEIECHCGRIFKTSFERFKYGHTKPKRQCDVCSGYRYDLKEVKRIAKEMYNCEYKDDYYNNSDEKHIFICECGNEFSTTLNKLKTKHKCNQCTIGRINSNFLLKEEMLEKINSFGLQVKDLKDNPKEKSVFICTCGREFEISYSKMISSKKIRCNSCTKRESNIETLTNLYLQENGISFKQEYTFKDLKTKSNNCLRFDFAIFDNFNNLLCLLELDGKQHFEISQYAQTEDVLNINKKHDKMKDNYCLNKKIKLFRIPYWKFNDIYGEIDKILKQVNPVPSLT